MTPKEKAFQLINRYLDINEEQEYNTPRYLTKEEAVEGALITVDEIIHNNNEINGPGDGWIYVEENTDYWQQVKIEIQKI